MSETPTTTPPEGVITAFYPAALRPTFVTILRAVERLIRDVEAAVTADMVSVNGDGYVVMDRLSRRDFDALAGVTGAEPLPEGIALGKRYWATRPVGIADGVRVALFTNEAPCPAEVAS